LFPFVCMQKLFAINEILMISHEGDVSDDVIKYHKNLRIDAYIVYLAVFCRNGAYGIGCYQYLMCQCELLFDLYVRYFITDAVFTKYFEI